MHTFTLRTLSKAVSLVILGGLLGACQDEASTPEPQKEASPMYAKGLTLTVPSDTDLVDTEIVSPSLAPINTNTDYVSFISPLYGEYQASQPVLEQASQSDEYWLNVTGAELNAGVTLTMSQAASLVRIAPRSDLSSGALMHAEAIAPERVQIQRIGQAPQGKAASSSPQASESLVKSMVSAEALASAGLVDDSSALQMSEKATAGEYRLQVNQPLTPSANYLVNVKEKGSPYQLSLKAPTAVAADAQSVGIKLALSQSDNQFAPQAKLKQADGEIQTIAMVKRGDTWQAQIPQGMQLANSNAGFSEIEVTVQTQVDGRPVQRTVKSVFKSYVNSASIKPEVLTVWDKGLPNQVNFELNIAETGRFGLSGVLTGTNAEGQRVAIMRTQAANWLTPESSKLKLMFDPKLIQASGLQPPFELNELELQDQGQMARLSFQANALVLTR
ncbi:DUF4785 domain-containing protein [Shewanella sp. CG12_big_fil_rev_8_21_14_0_65_47_15]|uniref:DUF4785 domain-containing protein n=1 Tax=Shewanella sp. CG12_big_fil_rev_8_21_14_0_65_47_15 TaxID=1975537 RepID=UPI000CBE5BA4|nr:DUF4785 domain-containing protein [Shewanella sp. CG12_big_fil_rev_8_21_14_0_65_47_15]PIW62340.1 MAG: DUF4785 domain-containing protein [Shewanella sp. CG12_big_fil_rev_8_21_14_0_65_47_15]